MSPSSASDSECETKPPQPRLGECEVCGDKDAIYCCPKCEVKTCGLNCVTIHKKELECDGVRDRTKFVRIKDFTDTDLLSDYRLLEECARFVHSVKRDEKKKFTRIDKDLPVHLFKLKLAARKRGIVLHYLAQNFTRHKINSTRYNYKSNIINWRIEWVLPNADPGPLKFSDDKCPEGCRLSKLIDKYINPAAEQFEGSKALTFYKAAGLRGVKALLRVEKVKGCAKKFFELDPEETLAENLSGKCIVEFPIIFLVLKDHAVNFDVVTPEDEFDEENEVCKESGKLGTSVPAGSTTSPGMSVDSINNTGYRTHRRPLLTQKIAQEKKLKIEKEIKDERKKAPKNLLFTTGYSSEESIELSDDEENKT